MEGWRHSLKLCHFVISPKSPWKEKPCQLPWFLFPDFSFFHISTAWKMDMNAVNVFWLWSCELLVECSKWQELQDARGLHPDSSWRNGPHSFVTNSRFGYNIRIWRIDPQTRAPDMWTNIQGSRFNHAIPLLLLKNPVKIALRLDSLTIRLQKSHTNNHTALRVLRELSQEQMQAALKKCDKNSCSRLSRAFRFYRNVSASNILVVLWHVRGLLVATAPLWERERFHLFFERH